MSMVRLAAAAALAVSVALPAAAQGIPKAQSPEEVGFLASRLKRLSDRIEEGVKNNELPGAVVLIARNGKLVMFDSFGFRDKEAKAPMTNDTIFRIASMTKPITATAVMILADEGKLNPDDPVETDLHLVIVGERTIDFQRHLEIGIRRSIARNGDSHANLLGFPRTDRPAHVWLDPVRESSLVSIDRQVHVPFI